MLKIEISTAKTMRYDTIGDWFRNGAGTDVIEVQDMGNRTDELLIACHELVEWVLCQHRGITIEEVDTFDFGFKGEGEPGDDENCPYREQHQFATKIERLLCEQLGLEWFEYLDRTNNFSTSKGE